MKKLMMAITVFVVAFGFAAMTMAQAKANKVSGEVTAVDAQAKTVTVKTKDKVVTLMVTDMTKIKQGKEKMGLADIQAGAKVTAIFVEEGGNMNAKSIHIAAAKKK